jgi:lysophospholipase L1-like esterase
MQAFFIGDSLTLGVGDPTMRGWPGRVAAGLGRELFSAYNLGVRANTSVLMAERFAPEVAARRMAEELVFVFCFGTADTVREVAPEASDAATRSLFEQARALGEAFFMTPPPVADQGRNYAVGKIGQRMAAIAREMGVPVLDAHEALAGNEAFLDSLRQNDGIHPGPEGYDAWAGVVAAWPELLAALRR